MLLFPATYTHNNFAFNSHLDAAGAKVIGNVLTTVELTERQINPAFRDVRDPYHLTQGGSLGRIHKNFLILQIAGIIKAPDATPGASLSDREREMMAAFDPALCLRDSPSTLGAHPFLFSERTTDTATYPSGIIPLQYWCRPADSPTMREAISEARRTFAIALVVADPRAYEQTEQTLALSSGTPSGNVVNRGTVPAPLKATIVMSGAGAANFTIARAGVNFVLDLSSFAAGTVVVVFETCAPYGIGRSITRSGVSIFGKKTSNASTWLDVPVGTTSFAISNLTGITSCTLAWYSARA